MYTYNLKIFKEQREEVKRKNPNLAGVPVRIPVDVFESGRDLWNLPEHQVERIIKNRLQRVSDNDLPEGHELDDKEHVRLIINYNSDEIVFDGELEIPSQENDRKVKA